MGCIVGANLFAQAGLRRCSHELERTSIWKCYSWGLAYLMKREMTKLGDVAGMLVGFAFKSQQFLDASEDGVRLVRGDNVQQGYIRWGDKAMKWRNDAYDDLARYQLRTDDVILAMDRPIVGGGLKLAWINDQDLPCLLVQRVTRIRGIPQKASTNYLRYALSAPSFVAHIERITTGANIPHISGKDIASFEFQLPPIDEQDRAVEVLAAYDDLIATNQRRIALLEESARLLYREWFVKLRFPGYESVKVVEGLPDGWSRVCLSEIATVNSSSISNKDAPETIRYIDIASVQTGIISQLNEMPFSDAPGRARRRVKHGDVIWSCVRPNRKSYALIWEPSEEVIASTGFAVLTLSTVPFSYLYLATTTDDFVAFLTNRATGAAYPAVTAKDFQVAEILKPSSTVLADFHANVEPLLALQDCLKKQNNELAEARDALLPKLMSGQLAV